jgi:hypothetical protein
MPRAANGATPRMEHMLLPEGLPHLHPEGYPSLAHHTNS